jgi:hypothetical protein
MRRRIGVIAATLLLTSPNAALALGSRVHDCTSPASGLELLDLHPELSEACEAIIQFGDHRYVKLGAHLRQQRDALLVLRLNGSTQDMALSERTDDRFAASEDGWPRRLPVGSALSIYVPEDRVLEVFADAGTLADVEVPIVLESTEPADSRMANYTCCRRRRPWYPIVDVLPTTAGPLPVMGLVGAGLLVIAAALRGRRLRRR